MLLVTVELKSALGRSYDKKLYTMKIVNTKMNHRANTADYEITLNEEMDNKGKTWYVYDFQRDKGPIKLVKEALNESTFYSYKNNDLEIEEDNI